MTLEQLTVLSGFVSDYDSNGGKQNAYLTPLEAFVGFESVDDYCGIGGKYNIKQHLIMKICQRIV
jgi:hypothetical protein